MGVAKAILLLTGPSKNHTVFQACCTAACLKYRLLFLRKAKKGRTSILIKLFKEHFCFFLCFSFDFLLNSVYIMRNSCIHSSSINLKNMAVPSAE